MRKITKQMLEAYLNEKPFKMGNTEVKIVESEIKGKMILIVLHGYLIAQKQQGFLWITNAGWFSNVTKERLNALPGVSICQKNFYWYLNGKNWNGEFTKIN